MCHPGIRCRVQEDADDLHTFDRFGTSSKTGSSSSVPGVVYRVNVCGDCDDGGVDICACVDMDVDGDVKGSVVGCEHATPQRAAGTQRTLTMASAAGGAVETCRCFVMRNAEFS